MTSQISSFELSLLFFFLNFLDNKVINELDDHVEEVDTYDYNFNNIQSSE